MNVDSSAARPGVLFAVPGLFAQVDRRLPAPVGEDAEQQARAERCAAGPEGVEPVQSGVSARRAGCRRRWLGRSRRRRTPGATTTLTRIRMFCSRADTSVPSTQIQVISSTRAMAAGIVIVGVVAGFDQAAAAQQLPEAVEPEPDTDVGQRADDEHAGHHDRPAADPAEPRAHRPGHPAERCATVGVHPVEVEERGGDERHRHERRQQDARRVGACKRGDRPDDRGQRVRRPTSNASPMTSASTNPIAPALSSAFSACASAMPTPPTMCGLCLAHRDECGNGLSLASAQRPLSV